MSWVRHVVHRLETAAELLGYVARRRAWMFPVLAALLGLSALVAFAQASQISPLIYTLF